MVGLRTVGCALVILGANQGCMVDVSGIPDDRRDASTSDIGPGDPDLGAEDLGPPPDLGPVPDLVDCVAAAETCDGLDEDCDGRVDEDIAAEPCDDDGDGCRDGQSICVDGSLTCEGDGATTVGAACDGLDADSVAEGTFACVDDALTCADDCVPVAEVCNQRDDDCDGSVDEDGACSDESDDCRAVRRGDALYLFCTDPGGESWDGAEDECARGDYVLARIDDEDERAFLAAEAGDGGWWVGARTDRFDPGGRRDPDNWTWRPSDAAVDSELWADDEPSGDGSCAHIWDRFDGRLNDNGCGQRFDYICEGTVLP